MALRSIRVFLSLAVAFAMAGTMSRLAHAEQNKPKAALIGTWELNHDLSDKAGQTEGGPQPGSGGRRGPGGAGMGGRGGGYGGGGGRGGYGGGGREMPDREEMERRRAAMEAIMHVSSRLIIVNTDSGLLITDDDGVSTRLALGGSKETGAINGVPFETTTKWEGDTLRVEKKFKGGLKVEEAYSVSSDPRRLTISTRIEGGRGGGRTMKRVYDLRDRSF